MSARLFLLSLLAVNVSLHLLRFPHLILENGGGAFLILFFLVLNFLALPLLVTEKILDNKLREIDIRSLIHIKKPKGLGALDRLFVLTWFGLRIFVQLIFLWFFLYLSSTSLLYLFYFMGNGVGLATNVVDSPSIPDVSMGFVGALLWSLGSFAVFLKWRQGFIINFTKWILPFCFVILLFLFLKVILSVNDFEGLKALFYPDFSALTTKSLQLAIGHSLACLFIGVGFYNRLARKESEIDSIELFIRAIVQTIALAMLIGVMALPMIQQVSETPFGSNWIFEILPRWLSYGSYGNYYCSLFFLMMSFIGFYISILLFDIISKNLKLPELLKNSSASKNTMSVFIVVTNALVILLFQKSLQGWSGQSLLLSVDHIVVDLVMPLIALIILWVVFRYTKKRERMTVFSHQQVFFHNRFFFQIWEKTALVLVPFLIILSWVLRLFD